MKYLVVSLMSLFLGITAQAKEKEIELKGYCPVCYLAAGKAVPGTAEFQASYKGRNYLFASQDALDAFKKSPGKFIPAYNGNCAFCVVHGKIVPGDPKVFMVHQGRIFLNESKALEAKFKKNLKGNISKADTNWKNIERKNKKAVRRKS